MGILAAPFHQQAQAEAVPDELKELYDLQELRERRQVRLFAGVVYALDYGLIYLPRSVDPHIRVFDG